MFDPKIKYDTVIVGGGIGGLFAAHEINKVSEKKILIIEKGKDAKDRRCRIGDFCCSDYTCNVLSGVGGAGGFSDGKITLSPKIGTHYEGLLKLKEETVQVLLDEVQGVIEELVPNGVFYGKGLTEKKKISDSIGVEGYKGYHIGTDGAQEFSEKMQEKLKGKTDFLTSAEVVDIEIEKSQCDLTVKSGDKILKISCENVIFATGLDGASFVEQTLKKLGISQMSRSSDFGIRFETSKEVFSEFTESLYDFKIYFTSDKTKVRTFCVNHKGHVVTENHRGLNIRGVNGHSYLREKTANTNFAILGSIDEQLEKDPPKVVRDIAKKINEVGGGYPIYQELDEFLGIQTATTKDKILVERTNRNAREGDIRSALPAFLYDAFKEFLSEMKAAFPKIDKYQAFVYAPEIKYFQYKTPIDSNCKVKSIPLYIIGNASGYTANLTGAAVMGIIAGRHIAGVGSYAKV